jgi:hypothetical protein
MNVTTLTITAAQARERLGAYQRLDDRQRTLVDENLIRVYRRIARGEVQRVLNVDRAFQQTGLNEEGQPKLAMTRADWDVCYFHPRHRAGSGWADGGGLFTEVRRIAPQLRTNLVQLPAGTFNDAALTRHLLRTPVPHIPPQLRPTIALTHYHILFEVQSWAEYPVDPFLLRHIHGALYTVEAEWELSPLEAELLAALSADGRV